MKYDISKEFLIKHYTEEKLSTKQIASIVGCSTRTISARVREYGIEIRPELKIYNKRFPITKEFLVEHYVDKKMSCIQISELTGCSKPNILKKMKKFGIERRSVSESTSIRMSKPASRENLRQKRLGTKASDETKKKMSESGKGRVFSEEHKSKISSSNMGRIVSDETRLKKSLAQRGELSSNWKGGITPFRQSLRALFEYTQWRTAVFKRDNFTCQWCKSKKNLCVDHIKPFSAILNENNIETKEQAIACKELWDTNNGRTLCHECHKKTETFIRGASAWKET